MMTAIKPIAKPPRRPKPRFRFLFGEITTAPLAGVTTVNLAKGCLFVGDDSNADTFSTRDAPTALESCTAFSEDSLVTNRVSTTVFGWELARTELRSWSTANPVLGKRSNAPSNTESERTKSPYESTRC